MPRKSVAALTTLPRVDGRPTRLEPPRHLDKQETALFTELVGTCAPEHFVPADVHLLVSFVQATLLSRSAAAQLGTDPSLVTVWEKAVRVQAQLATRLRLAPSARSDPKSIARARTNYPASVYDLLVDGREPWSNAKRTGRGPA
jgi:hypothetical protein